MTAKTPASKTTMTLFTTKKAINEACESIHATGTTLQTLMHKTACSVLLHFGKHQDKRVVMKFLNSLPDMTRKNAVQKWFETFGNMKFSDDTIVITDAKVRLGNAIDKPFWKFKANEGMPYQALEMLDYAEAQIKKLEKDAKETKRDHSALIAVLRTIAAAPTVQ